MIFTSTAFLLFFPLVVAIFFLLPHRFRWVHLLVASYYFYMAWKPVYALLMVFSTITAYLVGRLLGKYKDQFVRKSILAAGIFLNLALLFFFKYYNFFAKQSREFSDYLGITLNVPALDMLLPIGISFYTFHALSYVIDVYKHKVPAEKHLGLLAIYISFFPQLVAGPIQRSSSMLPQLSNLLPKNSKFKIKFEYDRVVSGLRLMFLGFFKKVVLADNFALIVQPVYASPQDYSGFSALIATVAFTFQIFFDFSAYTDIARGASRTLGFELMENFQRPYFATNIQEFWRRWHISLSSWFRDYLYIPMGGDRVSRWQWVFNLWIVFLLCGLWHGASWTFVVWGALHGFYYFIFYALTPPVRWLATRTHLSRFPRVCRVILVLITFSMVCWAWVVFRADNIATAVTIWENLLRVPFEAITYVRQVFYEGFSLNPLVGMGLEWLAKPSGKLSLMPVYLFLLTIFYFIMAFKLRREERVVQFSKWPTTLRWASYCFGAVSILLLGQFGAAQFIYFQF